MATKRKIFLFDTETIGIEEPFVYDIGWRVVDKSGRVYSEQNYLVREVVTNPEKMASAYYHKKIYTDYLDLLDIGAVTLLEWTEIIELIREECAAHSVDVLSAYNLRFDIGAMRRTSKLLRSSPVFNYRPDLLCLYVFACKTAFRSPLYHDLANMQGWVSPAGNVRTTAEHAYRFLSGDWSLVEDHTAASDTRIETEILARLMQRKTPIPYNDLTGNPWRIAQTPTGNPLL